MPPSNVPEAEIRGLLGQIRGVETVEVRTSSEGRIESIAIRVDDGQSPRRVVRDVESALLSGLGIRVDHRAIRIVANGGTLPVIEGPAEAPPAQSLQYPDTVVLSPDPRDRVRLCAVRTKPDGELYCEVTVELEVDGEWFGSTVREADTRHARMVAAGRAALDALRRTLEEETAFALEGLQEFEIADQPAVIASVRARRGWSREAFFGTALVEGGPEDAAARAVLDALNRFWTAEERATG